MQAESLIALEAAIAELGLLYAAGRLFADLHEAAERELLPQLNNLSRRLRAAARHDRLNQPQLDEAAREIVAVALHWRGELEDVRRSAPYQEALDAFAKNDQTALQRLLPRILCGLISVDSAGAPVYVEFSASMGRRRPGAPPFLTPAACAQEIVDLHANGIEPQISGNEWWERDLPPIECAASADRLESVIALRIDELPAALFATESGTGLVVFAPQLRASFAVALAPTANDEWWEANPLPYPQFREQLLRLLHESGLQTEDT